MSLGGGATASVDAAVASVNHLLSELVVKITYAWFSLLLQVSQLPLPPETTTQVSF
jgi:hypothetical protein